MTSARFIWNGVRHHLRSHLGTLAGAAVASAVLVGALVVGDSVRFSLRTASLLRLGQVEHAIDAGDRLFTLSLATNLASALQRPVAAVLRLPGTATIPDSGARANQVHVLGIEASFWGLASGPDRSLAAPLLNPDEVWLNDRLARQLNAALGSAVVLRVIKPSALSRDAPLAAEEDSSVALRLKVARILQDSEFGRFSLQASQTPPFNAFISRSELQARTETRDQANVLLIGQSATSRNDSQPLPATVVREALQKVWNLEDAQLALRQFPGGFELRTSRVFMDRATASAAMEAVASRSARSGLDASSTPPVAAFRVLTYFVNELAANGKSTPYSMVTALEAPWLPVDLRDDEILINQWLATDLGAAPGSVLRLRYYVVGLGRALEERTAEFKIRAVLPMQGPSADPTLMPDFPGLTDADNCRDWDTGFPIDTAKIRENDEKYWDDYRGAPKAIISYSIGAKLWGNRFGDLTAVRYAGSFAAGSEGLSRRILSSLKPESVSIQVIPARLQAEASVSQSQDFGGLFLGFSFFLIGAALILLGMFFRFALQQRSREAGILLALGFAPARVRRFFLGEGLVIGGLGACLGAILGMGYAWLMLRGLATAWRAAVGTQTLLLFHATPPAVIGGIAVAWGVIAITLLVSLRRLGAAPTHEILSGKAAMDWSAMERPAVEPVWRRFLPWGFLVGAAALLLLPLRGSSEPDPGSFFGVGALLLVAGLSAFSRWLRRISFSGTQNSTQSARQLLDTLSSLALRNTARRRDRSLATAGLIGSALFLVASIGVFRLDAIRGAERRDSGTGGFSFLAESSLPLVRDLNLGESRDLYGLNVPAMTQARFVNFRVHAGEEASCLNLNRAQRPRLLGVRPQELAGREAFRFAKTLNPQPQKSPWLDLDTPLADGAIPAIGDQASILWALGKKVGEELVFANERGEPVRVRLVGAVANSVLQGSLIISEANFVQMYPNESGFRFFLIDVSSSAAESVAAALNKGLRDFGFELAPAIRRLAEFNAVQNTYLGTFQVLGGLGLVLGSVGLGVLVLRQVLERQSELALMLALGFPPAAVRRLVTLEHVFLLVAGIGLGVGAAAITVGPAVMTLATPVPWFSLARILTGITISGLVWTALAARWAMGGRLLEGLRSE